MNSVDLREEMSCLDFLKAMQSAIPYDGPDHIDALVQIRFFRDQRPMKDLASAEG